MFLPLTVRWRGQPWHRPLKVVDIPPNEMRGISALREEVGGISLGTLGKKKDPSSGDAKVEILLLPRRGKTPKGCFGGKVAPPSFWGPASLCDEDCKGSDVIK
ncbi:hypothetical protein RRG08_057352 [Elysia crispata]|uniref:Uncharacterized protein n=1 Tax=Elysia crispata TaxID=231223 RepID=A0AAE1D0B6_9GAST|nr:hypothetical protein RRG08_057352 [Elysia crispata]